MLKGDIDDIVLLQPDKVSTIDTSKFKDWIYLGYSYPEFKKLENHLGESNIMNSFAERISKKANELRNEFLIDFSKISQINSSIYWHISETAENNTMCNNLFLDLCYYWICSDILKENEEQLVIIVKNEALLQLLYKKYKPLKSIKNQCFRTKSLLLYIMTSFVYILRSNLSFLFKFTCRKLIIYHFWRSRKNKYHIPGDNILVYTFSSDSCFRNDGYYQERYYGELINRIQTIGSNIIYFLHGTGFSIKNYIRIVKWLNASKNTFILLEEQVTFRNAILSLFASFQLLRTKIPDSLSNEALQFLLRKTIGHEALNGNIRTYYLYYNFVKNISKNKNIKFQHLLDIYEGHIIERILRFSVKKNMPSCKTIGFSHTTFSKNHLSFFSSLNSPEFSLKPDYLLCTGAIFKNIFKEHGFDEKKIFIVGNLRQDFTDDWHYNPKVSDIKKIILVALPLLILDAQELLMKVIAAFEATDYEIQIYKHPMMSFESLGILESKLPDNIEFKNEPTNLGLQKSNLLITTGSNMSVNALKIGMPVISMVRSVGLSFEPLDWFNSPITYYSLPDEIFSNSKRLLSQSSEDYNHYSTSANTLANECLEPVNSIEIERFIKQLKNVRNSYI